MRTWIAYLLLAFLPCLLCSKQECKADEHQHVADALVQTGNSSKPSPSGLDSGVAPHQIESTQEKNSTYGQKPQTDWCEVAVKAVIGNWPLIIIAIVGTCAAIRTFRAFVIQIKEMNRQTVAMRMAAEAAHNSAEAVRNSERAWILIDKISPNNKEIKGGMIPVFGYRFKVFGKTPAKIVEVAFRYRIVESRQRGNLKEPDLPTSPEYGKSPEIATIPDIGSVLPPLRKFDVAVILESNYLSWTEHGLITSREKFLCSYGFIKYIDAFDRAKVRETRFCYVYDAKRGGILKSVLTREELSPDDFHVGGPVEYNDAT